MFCPSLSDSHRIKSSKTDGFTESRGSEQQKKITSTIHHNVYLLGDEINFFFFFAGEPGGKLDVLTECQTTLTAHGKSVTRANGWSPARTCDCFIVGDGWGKGKNSHTSNTWACYRSNQKQPNSRAHYVKAKPTPADEGSSVKGSLLG